MAIRYKPNSQHNFGQAPLPSGYDASPELSNFSIPSCGIEDVDTGLFNLFDKVMHLQVSSPDLQTGAMSLRKVPIIFSAGEKWAMIKNGRSPRDKSGTLILPLITIGRKNIAQTPNDDISGRGINQQTGELVIRRRLSHIDREYQNLINRLLIPNQKNVALSHDADLSQDQISTSRTVGDMQNEIVVDDGGLLLPNRKNNVWETITIPAPQFYTAQYDVIIWAQYDIQMNQILEQIMASFLPQGNAWRIDASDRTGAAKGYWFVATVDGNLYTSQNNYDDMSTTERMIKYQFSINVPAYVLASKTPGAPVPIRRYISSPTIEFSIATGVGEVNAELGVDDPFIGSDDPTLPLLNKPSRFLDQRDAGQTRLYPNKISPNDPALNSYSRGTAPARYKKITGINKEGKRVTRHVKIKTTNNSTGETVYSGDTDLGGLKIVVVED